jgi:hypothetical protein
MTQIEVGEAHLGKSLMQVSTSQVLLDHFALQWAKEPILLLTMLIIGRFEIFIMVVEYLPQGRIGGLSGVIDRRMGRHWESFTQHSASFLDYAAGV